MELRLILSLGKNLESYFLMETLKSVVLMLQQYINNLV